MELNFKIKKTKNCSPKEINGFYQLAKKADQVEINGLLNRIQNSYLLGFCYSKEVLVGISCIKNPSVGYKRGAFIKAGIKKEAINFQFELGYSFTEKKFRGNKISFNLNKILISELAKKSIYSTTANPGMKVILSNLGFSEIGESYEGVYNTNEIQIFGITLVKNTTK